MLNRKYSRQAVFLRILSLILGFTGFILITFDKILPEIRSLKNLIGITVIAVASIILAKTINKGPIWPFGPNNDTEK